jgi:hypothetical protein
LTLFASTSGQSGQWDVREWEAKGDRLRDAGRRHEAVEAYRTALRYCLHWHGPAAERFCTEIRDKIRKAEADA